MKSPVYARKGMDETVKIRRHDRTEHVPCLSRIDPYQS